MHAGVGNISRAEAALFAIMFGKNLAEPASPFEQKQRRGEARCRQQLLQEQPPQREQGRRLCLPGPQVPVAGQGLCREHRLLLGNII